MTQEFYDFFCVKEKPTGRENQGLRLKTIDCAQIRENEFEFYTVVQTCKLLGIGRRTLYRYAAIALVKDRRFKQEWGFENPRKRGRKITPYQLKILEKIKDDN